MKTHGSMTWEIGTPRETSGSGKLCGPGWLHYYSHPLLAVIFNPIHAGVANPLLHTVKVEGLIKSDQGLKFGCTRLTLIETIPLPVFTTAQQLDFSSRCLRKVCADPAWLLWADDWLSSKDRSAAVAAAVWAAWAVGRAESPLDLIALAEEAMT